MYQSDFIKSVKELSDKYTIRANESYSVKWLNIYYDYNIVLSVGLDNQYDLDLRIPADKFDKITYSHKLYMLAAEFSLTPVIERTAEGYKLEENRKRINSIKEDAQQAIIEARSALRRSEHLSHSHEKLNDSSKPEYTGIRDTLGHKIFVGDKVVPVNNYEKLPGYILSKIYTHKPEYRLMPRYVRTCGEPFKVNKDSYLYGHWIARSVSLGSTFGIEDYNFGKNLFRIH